jgi:hypothetical protein
MKRYLVMTLAALLVCSASAIAGQLSTTWTLRNVVDPPELRDGLNADAQAADARLDAIDGGTASGNIPVARITNALTTAGASIGGNIPKAAITNALGSAGANIGGNIPVAALTNAFNAAGALVTNVVVAVNYTTNTIVLRPAGAQYIVESWTQAGP